MPDFERLLNAIDEAEENSYGSDSDGDLANNRAKAIDYYLGKMPPAPDGRSQVVDRSVYETIQWQLPSLSRIFANGDDVVELPPIGPEDEEGAKQEAQYLNYLLLQKNNWFEVFNTSAKDALLTKAGYLYAYRDKRRQIESEKYERQTQEGVALAMRDGAEVISMEEYPDPDYQPQPQIDPMGQPAIGPDGQPVMAPPPMLYDLEIRRTKEEKAYCVKPLPPERCKVAESHNEVQLVDCPYFEFYDFATISELRQTGLEVEDEIGDSDDAADTEEDASRDQFGERSWEADKPIDPAMRKVKTRWIWIKHDYDEDGLSELNYVIRVGRTILHREEVNEIPVGVLCPDPLPHRHVGLSVADSTMDLQELATSTLRQGMDNLYLANNPRTFATPMVNLDDLLVSRPGGVVRGKSGAQFGVDLAPIVVPNVFPQAIEALEFFKQLREDRSGVSRYFTGTDANALNKTATGVQQLSTMAAARVEQIARHMANGIERLCAVLHALVLKGGHQKEVVKLRGKWVQIDPSTWRSRTDFRIAVGYAAGNKDAAVNRLMLIAQMQEKALAGGLPIVQPQNVYETAVELTKASDFSTPERFWTDPANAPPQPPPQPDVTVMAAEQLRAQTEMQKTQLQTDTDKYESDNRVAVDKYKTDVDAQVKLSIATVQGTQAVEIERERGQNAAGLKQLEGNQSAQLEQTKAALNPKVMEQKSKDTFVQQFMESQQGQTQAIAEMFQRVLEAIQKMGGPRRVVRGRDGRVEGVEPLQ